MHGKSRSNSYRWTKAVLLLCLGAVLPASALAQISGTITRVTMDPASHFGPAISGNLICYTEIAAAGNEVFCYDLSTKTEFQVTAASPAATQTLGDVSGNTIVYTEFNIAGGSTVYYCVVTSETTSPPCTPIAISDAASDTPAINGSLVAWVDYASGTGEIYAMDLANPGVTKQITNNPGQNSSSPNVSGRLIAYSTASGTTCQVFVTNFDTLSTTQLTNSAGCNSSTDIYGTKVVYQANRDGNQDIYVYDMNPPTSETRIGLPGVQQNPHISGDWVSFEDLNTANISSVRLFQISTGQVLTAVSASTALESAALNDIDGNNLAFTSAAAGNLDIYLFQFTPPGVPVPTQLNVLLSPASIPVGQSSIATITLTVPGLVSPLDPTTLPPITLTSPILSDMLSNNGMCTLGATATPNVLSCTITITSVEPNNHGLLASFPRTANLAPSTGSAELMVTAALQSQPNCINSDFRNVAVPGGSYLWFNSVFKVRDVSQQQKITISFFNSSVQFQYTDPAGNLVNVNQPMPDAKIVIDPSVPTASTTFDSVNNVWITTIPFDLDDNAFLTALPWLVPSAGLPPDVEPVTWCGTFASDTADIDIGWRWAAAAYSSFSVENGALGVKPMDTDHDNQATNHDRAGAPENFTPFVIPGARGKGGKNYTGSYSRSAIIE